MRHVGLISIATLGFLGGCMLTGVYDYAGYDDTPAETGGSGSVSSSSINASSTSGGVSGMGGAGGNAGMGGTGGGAICPPEVCDDGPFDPCRMSDCSLVAQNSFIFGGPGHQAIKAMVAPGNGDIVLGGNYTDTLDFGNNVKLNMATASIRPFVAKLDSNGVGVVAFERPESGFTFDVDANATATTLYGTGVIFDPDMTDLKTIFVQKFGQPGWSYSIGKDIANDSAGVARGGTAHVFMAGHFKGPVSTPGCPEIASYTGTLVDSLVMQFAEDSGKCTWVTKIDNSYARSIDATPKRVVVGGYFSGTIGLNKPPPATSDTASFFVVYDAGSHAIIAQNFLIPLSGSTINLVNVAFDSKDKQSVYVTAKFRGAITINGDTLISTQSGADPDMLVAKFAPNGTLIWIDRFGGLGEQVPYSITPSNGDIFISGTTANGMELVPNVAMDSMCASAKCMFILKLSANTGAPIWGRTFGQGEGASDATAVSAADVTNFWLGGGWSSAISFDADVLLPMPGTQDIVLAKFTSLPL